VSDEYSNQESLFECWNKTTAVLNKHQTLWCFVCGKNLTVYLLSFGLQLTQTIL